MVISTPMSILTLNLCYCLLFVVANSTVLSGFSSEGLDLCKHSEVLHLTLYNRTYSKPRHDVSVETL